MSCTVAPVVFGATAICHGVAMLWRSLGPSGFPICHGVAMLFPSYSARICHGVAMLWRCPVVFGATAYALMLWQPGSPVVFSATAICHGVAMLWRYRVL